MALTRFQGQFPHVTRKRSPGPAGTQAKRRGDGLQEKSVETPGKPEAHRQAEALAGHAVDHAAGNVPGLPQDVVPAQQDANREHGEEEIGVEAQQIERLSQPGLGPVAHRMRSEADQARLIDRQQRCGEDQAGQRPSRLRPIIALVTGRVAFRCRVDQLVDFLVALATSPRLLSVTGLTVSTSQGDPQGRLNVQLTIGAATRTVKQPKEAAAAAH